MPRTSKANPVVDEAAVEESTAAPVVAADKDVDVKEETVAKSEPTPKKQVVAPLDKNDEIEVVSLIPNVSYKDSNTGDIWTWTEVGQVETMTFDVVQRMWQKSKTYFKSMWLKPLDDRVIKKFGLSGTYDKYDFLMDESNYTRKNIDKVCESIRSTPSNLKLSLCNKVKSLVASGKVSDITVIRAMENDLKIDLISLVD